MIAQMGVSSPMLWLTLPVRRLLLALAALLTLVAPALAQANTPSGLPLPRFATTRSEPINVRVGPGTKYEVAWIYVKAGVPVEIIQEFDTWRKIRDADGSEGWVHQNLLSGRRSAYVTPWNQGETVPLKARGDTDAGIRAWLGSGFQVQVAKCDGKWCEVSATGKSEGDRSATYNGYVAQNTLWGVYQNEIVD